jgi:hypothetical protein
MEKQALIKETNCHLDQQQSEADSLLSKFDDHINTLLDIERSNARTIRQLAKKIGAEQKGMFSKVLESHERLINFEN